MKNTFLMTVGSERTMFMTMDIKMTQKLMVKAYVLLLAIVANMIAIAI